MSTFKPIYFIKTTHTNGLHSAYIYDNKAKFNAQLKKLKKSVWLVELRHGIL